MGAQRGRGKRHEEFAAVWHTAVFAADASKTLIAAKAKVALKRMADGTATTARQRERPKRQGPKV